MSQRRTPSVAYFCMEFGLDASFPIYSGGLGVLAGDFIKSAHDLALPLVAVGLRWERGYCVQRIGPDGRPHDEFPLYDHSFLEDTGVRVRVRVRGEEVPCSVWCTQKFGNVPLFLIEPFRAEHRWITHRLYEAGSDARIAQEILLGIGGLRALRWLGVPITTYHFNEGHAVFAGLELLAEAMENRLPFPDAWAETRRQIVFTTHTPVQAGNEQHAVKELRRMGACLELSGAEMRAVGGDPFNMTIAGLRLSRLANAVSQLHGETARAMWEHVDGAAPILAITNGVHAPTWQDAGVRAAADGEALARARSGLRRALREEIARRGDTPPPEDAMVIGFARRAAGYKRSDLILRDPARLARLLEGGRVALVFSGKAHPDDENGKQIIAEIVRAARAHPGAITFLENYDMDTGRLMTRGCDVWLNNPVRPLEASGTSGMKAGMNGCLNLSILDGWWPEACDHGVDGWAIGDGTAGDDASDLDALYTTLERDVLPAWRDPARWQAMMRESVRVISERFSSDRMVREYFERLYVLPKESVK
jgi:glycogen phosphorylase